MSRRKSRLKSQGQAVVYTFKGTSVDGKARHFTVHKRGGVYWINSVTKAGVVEQPCHISVHTVDQMKKEIVLLCKVTDVERVIGRRA